MAAHYGWTPITAEDVGNLTLPGVRQLRGFRKEIDGVEVCLLTAVNRWRGGGHGETNFHLCWVSADPINRRLVDDELHDLLDVRRFRQGDALAYAWIPQEDGSRRSVSRSQWERGGHGLTRREGMRMVLTNQHRNMVAITYLTPVEDCADWCY